MSENDIIDFKTMQVYTMIALRGIIVFPDMTVNFEIARDKSLIALQKVLDNNEKIFLAPQRSATVANPSPKDIFRVGTICRVKQIFKLTNDNTRVSVEGISRAVIRNFEKINPYFQVTVEDLPESIGDPFAVEAQKRLISNYFSEYKRLDNKLPPEVDADVNANPSKFCNTIGQYVFNNEEKRRDLYAEPSLEKRLEMVGLALSSEMEILKVEKKIAAKVRKSMDKGQREYYLREQAKAIHEELGDGEDELVEYLERAEKMNLPEEALEKIKKEVKRMQKMSATSPEAGVSRTYVEWLLDLPWSKSTDDNKNLVKAREILDADHYGLEKVKERILEYLAVIQLTKSLKGPILCFVGPPGVGKTSIVKSIAKTLDRKFVSMSLGGVKDEAEIRGHRRTYIGAIPGRIIYHIKQCGANNPVFLLDEIDKMSSDYRGDPTSAMLEVLDPEQNFQYRDHYIELPFDLSKVLFVTTANTMEDIPLPLLDRMEIIELDGYTEEEKIQIAKRYLLPKQKKLNGIENIEVNISDSVFGYLIATYSRESGVRGLEKLTAGICRKIAMWLVEGVETAKSFTVNKENADKYLGIPKYLGKEINNEDEVGTATGLAWTSVGGKTMNVEVTLIPDGKGEILLTGQLGDVMKESARTAISLVRSRANEWGIDPKLFSTTDIHLHVPEGATPKDGPSAGITIATAILSAFTHKKVDRFVAMTGEITLRGKVLPIGGLKEKMLAAHRVGIKHILVPKENYKDLTEIPESIKSDLKITLVETIGQVFENAIHI